MLGDIHVKHISTEIQKGKEKVKGKIQVVTSHATTAHRGADV
jgi:hypothetical protein